MGGFVRINVADPATGGGGNHSIGQFAFQNNPATASEFSNVEMGWRKHTGVYGDDEPHLFTYANKDNYSSHGTWAGIKKLR